MHSLIERSIFITKLKVEIKLIRKLKTARVESRKLYDLSSFDFSWQQLKVDHSLRKFVHILAKD